VEVAAVENYLAHALIIAIAKADNILIVNLIVVLIIYDL